MDENVGTMLSQVARLLRREFDARARAIGVTRPQWQVLILVHRNAGISPKWDLAELLEVEPITLSRMIDRLQEAQLVERRPDPADRRAWRLFLTSKGDELLAKLMPLAQETYEFSVEGVSDEDRELMMAALLRMRANLSPRQPNDGVEGN